MASEEAKAFRIFYRQQGPILRHRRGSCTGPSDGITISVIIIIGFCVSCISIEMEELAEGVGNISLNDTHKKNRIQVSNTKKPLFFYVNLAKRYMQQHEEVELSALGMAIATVVTVAEILKNNGLAVEKRILTSTVDMKDEARGRPIQKAKVEIILAKAERFDELMDAAAEERELVGDADEHS